LIEAALAWAAHIQAGGNPQAMWADEYDRALIAAARAYRNAETENPT
jgi:hypothetical protein